MFSCTGKNFGREYLGLVPGGNFLLTCINCGF